MRSYLKVNDKLKAADADIFDYYASEADFNEKKLIAEKFHRDNSLAAITGQAIASKQDKYKFHVTLAHADYLKHQRALIKILIKYIQLGIIEEFKYTNQARVDKALKAEKEKANAERVAQVERFLAGDQITVYIPDGTDKKQVLAMCREINDYLVKANAKGGEHIANSVPLTSYLNLKQQVFDVSDEIDFIRAAEAPKAKREFVRSTSYYQFLARNLASVSDVAGELIPDASSPEDNSIFALLKTTEDDYSRYTREHCRFSILHIHGDTGRTRAKVFTNLASRETPQRNLLIVEHITKGAGNLNPHSYRTLLFKNILFPGKRSSVLSKEESVLFNKLLEKLKRPPTYSTYYIGLMLHLALMNAPQSLIMAIANEIGEKGTLDFDKIRESYPFLTSDVLRSLSKGQGSLLSFEQLKGLTERHMRVISDCSQLTISHALNFTAEELDKLIKELDTLLLLPSTLALYSVRERNFIERCIAYGQPKKTASEEPSAGAGAGAGAGVSALVHG